MYTCNFLNTTNLDPNVSHLLDNGGRLILGFGSKVVIVADESNSFCDYLNDGVTLWNAFIRAGDDWQADNPFVSHKVLYRAAYYGPDEGGTLNDNLSSPLYSYTNTGTKLISYYTNPNSIWGCEY